MIFTIKEFPKTTENSQNLKKVYLFERFQIIWKASFKYKEIVIWTKSSIFLKNMRFRSTEIFYFSSYNLFLEWFLLSMIGNQRRPIWKKFQEFYDHLTCYRNDVTPSIFFITSMVIIIDWKWINHLRLIDKQLINR